MAIRLSGLNSGLDTDAIVQELVSAYSLKKEKYQKEQTKIEWKQESWKALNTKIYGLYTSVSNLRYDSAYNLKKSSVSDASKAKVTASASAVAGTQTLNVNKMAQAAYITGAKLGSEGQEVKSTTKLSELGYTGGDTTITVNGTEIDINQDTTISDVVKGMNAAGVNANFDEKNGRIFVSAKESGLEGNFTLSADSANGNNALYALGLLTAASGYEQYATDTSKLATRIEAQDAVIRLNGVEYTSNTNSFTINGLTIEVTGVTDVIGTREKDGGTIEEYIVENPITITTSVDTQGIYDKIKDFLTEYNNVINEITKLYNAESASDYEPLTDEEKDAMSEEQIEKWETKIKSALLRRDSSLGSIMNTMVNTMAQGVNIDVDGDGIGDGTVMNLSDFGIKTLGFLNAAQNEQYAYHIDGDADDENTSGKTDKLMAAIQEDPDSVCKFMKQLASNLYTAVDQKMKSTELSSAYKVYNDKELDTQLTKYKKLISDWEDKVADQEEYYYNKFTQMEVALSKLQNQTNSLSGLLGQ